MQRIDCNNPDHATRHSAMLGRIVALFGPKWMPAMIADLRIGQKTLYRYRNDGFPKHMYVSIALMETLPVSEWDQDEMPQLYALRMQVIQSAPIYLRRVG